MHRIDTATSENGKFVNGNANQGIKGTQVDAAWLNSVQEELVKPITDAGLELSASDDNQLVKAMKILVAGMFEPISIQAGLSVTTDKTAIGGNVTLKKGDVVDITITLSERVAATEFDAVTFYSQDDTEETYEFDPQLQSDQTRRLSYVVTEGYTGPIGYSECRFAKAQTAFWYINGVIIRNS